MNTYELDNIYCGECSAMMAKLPDDCIDLTATSPPYDLVDYDNSGNLVTHPKNGLRTYNGYTWDFASVAHQLYRVTKPGGVVVWVVGDATVNGSETGTSFRQALGFMEVGFKLHDTMIYHKINPAPQLKHQQRYTQSFEYMFVFSKGMPICNYISENTSTVRSSRQFYGTRDENGERAKSRYGYRQTSKILQNVWSYNVGNSLYKNNDIESDHPAIFPEALARDHIISWSNPGDVVLDPFMGSGTTAKAAKQLGRHYLGFEISQEYVNLANKRLFQTNPPLFTL